MVLRVKRERKQRRDRVFMTRPFVMRRHPSGEEEIEKKRSNPKNNGRGKKWI